MQNPQYRFIGPSPWSSKTQNLTEELPEKLPLKSTGAPGGITARILGGLSSVFWSWIMSSIRLFIQTMILMAVMVVLTTSKTSRCHIAGSRLYPAMQWICAFDRATRYSLGPLCIPFDHVRSPREFCENYDPFRFLSDAFMVVNQNGPVNYASSSGGASIVTEFTSQTHGRMPCSGSKSEIWACNLEKNAHINSPAVILEDGLVHGECWEFSGEKGQVAIKLTEPVVITHITLDRPAQGARSRAPKNMTLWALVNNRDHHSGDQGMIHSELPRSALRVRPESHSRVQNLLDFLPLYPSDTASFVQMLSFEYDIDKAAVSAQSFFIQDTQIKAQTVLLKVDGNFGGETTCLPPVGIYST